MKEDDDGYRCAQPILRAGYADKSLIAALPFAALFPLAYKWLDSAEERKAMETESLKKMSALCSNIQEALGRAIDFVIRYAGNRGVEGNFPQHTFQLQYFKPDSPTQATLVVEDRTENSFASFYYDHRRELDNAEPIAVLNSMCGTFKDAFGVNMRNKWRVDYGTIMLFRYFKKVGCFSYDEYVAAEVVDELKSDLTASTEKIELVYYVEGLRADSPFALWDDKISFAPMSDDDLVNYAERKDAMFGMHDFCLNSKDWICRILYEGDKSSKDFNNATEVLDHVLNALSLVSEGRACFRLLAKEVKNPFLRMGRISGGDPMNSGRGESIHLAMPDVNKFDEVLRKVIRVSTDERLKLLRYPLRRMRTAANRRSTADAFLDIIVALEGLLAHDTPALESTYRFRLRGAALLSDEFGSPQARLKSLNEMYAMRSRIVHGEDVSASLDILLERASGMLKFIFMRYLEFSDCINPEDIIRAVDESMVRQPCAITVGG